MRLLVANRGEIALRVIRTGREEGFETVAVYAADDAESPHVAAATEAVGLDGLGPAAYLDQAAVLAAATETGAELIHPGYGFLSENPAFARACAARGRVFVGPEPELLETFGDKSAARAAAVAAEVPVLPATEGPSGLDEVRALLGAHPEGVMIKALGGGGGRGLRTVRSPDELEEAYRACAAEAESGFGNPAVFAEALLEHARHVEVQIVAAPGSGGTAALALGDRDCSLQRRHQKLVEIAPAPGLAPGLRRALHEAAARLCAGVGFRGLATVEFLLRDGQFVFLEVNPRLQVEHTITEEVTGTDLVATQLAIATGAGFDTLDLPPGVHSAGPATGGDPARARGIAVQARVNMESMRPDGTTLPTTGTLTAFTPPTGPGIRVDSYGRPGLAPSPRYDSLLAKVITHTRASSLPAAIGKAEDALAEFVVDGVATNREVLQALLAEPAVRAGEIDTGFIARHITELAEASGAKPQAPPPELGLRPGEEALRAEMAGTVIEAPAEGTDVSGGATLAVLEAMKMQHVLPAPGELRVARSLISPGQAVAPGEALVIFTRTGPEAASTSAAELDLDRDRADLAETRRRHEITRDEHRTAAIAKRHERARRSARENVAELVDEGSFVEYGPLALAAQRSRRSEDDLIANTPADGLIAGLATIGAATFGRRAAEAVVVSYDYTVLAGTQGMRNHAKTDRIFDLAARKQVPLVLFAEGGGGRPGDTDATTGAGLELDTFRALGALNGRVPLVAIVSGRCFAGNAALAGACDVIVATPEANLGMGGPAMIEGGGLGTYSPEEIGPVSVQRGNGVIDLLARDEAHAVELAREYLSYFQGSIGDWQPPDPRLARHAVPENRLRAYDIHQAIAAIADTDSILELRPEHGVGVVTALIRVEGIPHGLIANSSHHLGGAIDAEAADKITEFLNLCESFRLPVVSLCDTPGFMVGPDAEKDATVRRFGRLFVAGARLTVPFGVVILRKGYGLGAMAMAGGSFRAPRFTIAWPTGEIGGMGLEGAVRLGYRKELDAAGGPEQRRALFDELLERAYQQGKALHSATTFELDDVIDPAETRTWIRYLT